MKKYVKIVVQLFIGIIIVIILGLAITYVDMKISENQKVKSIERIELK